MKKNIPIEFQSERKVIPNHIKWTWIFFPLFLLELISEELNIFFVHLTKDSIINFGSRKFNYASLKRNGFFIENGYLDENEVEKLKKLLLKYKNNKKNKSSILKKEIEGSIRYRFTKKPTQEIEELTKYNKLKAIYSTYSFKNPKISWMESFTSSMSKNQLIFAGHPHIDSYRHQLKFVIALEDVSKNNGPTSYLASTQFFNFDLLLCYFLTWIYEKRIVKGQKQFLPKKIIRDYLINKKSLFLMKKGDLSIFDSRGIHHGSLIESGERHLLWFYFD